MKNDIRKIACQRMAFGRTAFGGMAFEKWHQEKMTVGRKAFELMEYEE
jgi:hypothetical protein